MQIACGFSRSAKLGRGADRREANWGGNGRSGLHMSPVPDSISDLRFEGRDSIINFLFFNGAPGLRLACGLTGWVALLKPGRCKGREMRCPYLIHTHTHIQIQKYM